MARQVIRTMFPEARGVLTCEVLLFVFVVSSVRAQGPDRNVVPHTKAKGVTRFSTTSVRAGTKGRPPVRGDVRVWCQRCLQGERARPLRLNTPEHSLSRALRRLA